MYILKRKTDYVFQFCFLENITFVVALIMCFCPHFLTCILNKGLEWL